MKKCCYRYEDSHYEMLKEDGVIVIKDKSREKFLESTDVAALQDIGWSAYVPLFSQRDVMFLFGIVLFFFCLNTILYFMPQESFSITNLRILGSIVYTLIQVFFHELSHILALSKMGRKYSKFGVKLNYIFPSFYVRMNEIYMLTKNERLFVHAAGILFNVVTNGILLLLSTIFHLYTLQFITKLFFTGIVMNVFPILNSDGYKIMITLARYNEKHGKKSAPVMIMVISYINILVSILYFMHLIGIHGLIL